MSKDVIIKGIHEHLVSIGYSEVNAARSAQIGYEFFQRQVCNSRDPFKDSCDHAGASAQVNEPKIKYKSPKAKSRPRAKKPQEAFRF